MGEGNVRGVPAWWGDFMGRKVHSMVYEGWENEGKEMGRLC